MAHKRRSEEFNKRLTEMITVGKTKATSSKIDLDFHDLPYAGLEAAARRFAYGRKKHGRFNWKQGDSVFAEERLKHAINHAVLFMEERNQDDLDAVLCNFMMIAWYKQQNILSLNPVKDFMMQGKENVSNK
jgi:hypothetical protein